MCSCNARTETLQSVQRRYAFPVEFHPLGGVCKHEYVCANEIRFQKFSYPQQYPNRTRCERRNTAPDRKWLVHRIPFGWGDGKGGSISLFAGVKCNSPICYATC